MDLDLDRIFMTKRLLCQDLDSVMQIYSRSTERNLEKIKILEICIALTTFKERRTNGLKNLDQATQATDLNREVEVSIGRGNMKVLSKSEQNPYCVEVI